MLPRDYSDRVQIAFDDRCLRANAGRALPATLARLLGLGQLADRPFDLGGAPVRANTGDKMMTLFELNSFDLVDQAAQLVQRSNWILGIMD